MVSRIPVISYVFSTHSAEPLQKSIEDRTNLTYSTDRREMESMKGELIILSTVSDIENEEWVKMDALNMDSPILLWTSDIFFDMDIKLP